MKKIFLLAIMLIATEVKTSFALSLFSGYAGISVGAMYAKVNTDSEESASSQSPLVGIIAGIESNTLFVKFGIEGFAEKALAFSAKDGSTEYKDPFYYGAKGKFLFNLIFFDPYLAVGYGREAGNGGGNFFLGGLGVQAKILHFGAFAELNYLETSKSGDAKAKRLGLLVGLKYYFF
jgi:hypothetical protein